MTRTLDPYDELAALFLTGSAAPRNGAGEAAVRELIIVGHLPVRGGLWLAPYADAVGRDAGPTALLRMDDEPPHVQVFHAAPMQNAEPAPLGDVVTDLAGHVSRWIVRPPIDTSLSEIVLAGADRITILSSADEAARVTAYRLIKDVHLAAERVGARLPHLGVALLGCDKETGQRVFDRLCRTARSHLEIEVSLDMCLPRMDAGIVSAGWRRTRDDGALPTLERVLAWTAERPAPQRAEEPPPLPSAPAPASPNRPVEVVPPAVSAPAPARTPEREPQIDESGTFAEPWVARRTVKLRPKPEIDVEPKDPCLAREPDEDGRPMALASFVEGLLALPVRCPRREGVELAVDERGRLHLLGDAGTLRDMAVVMKWATDHRELLTLACPEHVIDANRAVRLHVFTAEPVDVADLHGSDIQLHVLAPVDVDGKRGWYAAALNKC